jgi:hypothetical protein
MQDFIVFGAVIAAAGYLGRYWWQSANGGGCSSCKSCSSTKKEMSAPKEPQLVQIDLGGSWKK